MSCIMANRVVLNCRKISRSVTCTVTGATGRTMVVVDDDNNDDDDDDGDDGVTMKCAGKRKEVLSVSEKCEDGVSALGIPTLDCQWP